MPSGSKSTAALDRSPAQRGNWRLSMKAYRYVVRGRVQGVGYRYFALREAETTGVAGFVRNLPDGSVEVVAEAAEEALARFEARLREGPSFARVSDVARQDLAARGADGFHIR